MEEAVGEKLLQVALDGAARELLAIDAHRLNLGRAVDLHSGGILHREHLLCCVLPQHLGHLRPARQCEVS